MQPNKEQMENYRDMLQALLDLEHGLTDKEIRFLDSLHEWQGPFTWKQIGWLEKIYQRLL